MTHQVQIWWGQRDSNHVQELLQSYSVSVAETILHTELIFCCAMLPLHHVPILIKHTNEHRLLDAPCLTEPTSAVRFIKMTYNLSHCTPHVRESFGGPWENRTPNYALQGHRVPSYTNSPKVVSDARIELALHGPKP